MADMLRRGAEHLAARRRQHMTSTVTYARAAASVQLPATPGRTEYTQQDGDGFNSAIEVRDWLLTRADLVLDGQPAEPQLGDVITTGAGERYQVTAPPDNSDAALAGPYGLTWRVHTRRIYGAAP